MVAEKQKKVYQVAKELNVATPAIVEFLEDRGFDMPKGHMSGLSAEMYVEVIKKFDPLRWQRQLEEETRVLDDSRRAEAERARAEQSLKILDEIAAQTTQGTEALIRQVEEQKQERARKAQTQTEQQEAIRLAEERRLADEAERARQQADEVVRKEAERLEKERLEVERREAERREAEKRAAAPRPTAGAPRAEGETTPRRDTGAPPQHERRPRTPVDQRPSSQTPRAPQGQGQDQRPATGYQGTRPQGQGYQGQRPQGAQGQGQGYQGQRPQGQGYQGQRPATGYQGTRPQGGPARPGEAPRGPARGPAGGPPRPGEAPRGGPRPPVAGRPPSAPPKPGAPSGPPRKRPTKEDIEALEKQKKLLAAQKDAKYRKVVVDAEHDSSGPPQGPPQAG